MANNRISILEELHFHRVFMRTNRVPSTLDYEPIISPTEIKLFIASIFNEALFLRNTEGWIDPFNTKEIMRNENVKVHYSPRIVDAVVHKCAIEESYQIALNNGFDPKELSDLPSEEAMKYMQKFIGLVVANTRPVNISFIYALAFACTMWDIVAKSCRQHLTCIALSAVAVFESEFPYEWIYYDFQQWSITYTFRHEQIHYGNL